MTVIEELREIAKRMRDMSEFESDPNEDAILDIADSIERSGALVPVPVGDAGEIGELEPSLFLWDDKMWLWDSLHGWCSPHDKTAELPLTHGGDLIVQPVRLIPITEYAHAQ